MVINYPKFTLDNLFLNMIYYRLTPYHYHHSLCIAENFQKCPFYLKSLYLIIKVTSVSLNKLAVSVGSIISTCSNPP